MCHETKKMYIALVIITQNHQQLTYNCAVYELQNHTATF